jgi:hypothetical protein
VQDEGTQDPADEEGSEPPLLGEGAQRLAEDHAMQRERHHAQQDEGLVDVPHLGNRHDVLDRANEQHGQCRETGDRTGCGDREPHHRHADEQRQRRHRIQRTCGPEDRPLPRR